MGRIVVEDIEEYSNTELAAKHEPMASTPSACSKTRRLSASYCSSSKEPMSHMLP
jgi:hypothetical protein